MSWYCMQKQPFMYIKKHCRVDADGAMFAGKIFRAHALISAVREYPAHIFMPSSLFDRQSRCLLEKNIMPTSNQFPMMMSGNVKLKTMKINAQIMSTCASRCRLSWRFINEICIFVVDLMMVTEICGTNARRLWCTTAADRTNHETTKAHIWRRQRHESDCNQYARRIGYRSTGIAAASTFTWGTFAVVYFPYLTPLFRDRKYWRRRTSDE